MIAARAMAVHRGGRVDIPGDRQLHVRLPADIAAAQRGDQVKVELLLNPIYTTYILLVSPATGCDPGPTRCSSSSSSPVTFQLPSTASTVTLAS